MQWLPPPPRLRKVKLRSVTPPASNSVEFFGPPSPIQMELDNCMYITTKHVSMQ
jgi:hypothetical protein